MPPTFFYNPNAYALGIIKAEDIVCRCCGETRAFSYQGSFYSRHIAAVWHPLCPWCIADGRAAARFEGQFAGYFDTAAPIGSTNADLASSHPAHSVLAASLEMVSQRTPGYISWQSSSWLTHCGAACVFLGNVGSKELQPLWDEVRPDILATGWREDDVRNCLDKDGDMTGYLFRCPQCGLHRLHLDATYQPYLVPQLPETAVFRYYHFDDFTQRMLYADLLVEATGNFHAELEYQASGRGEPTKHTYSVAHEPLPTALLNQLTALLADPGFATLPDHYPADLSDWDNLGSVQLIGRTATGLHRIDIEVPYGLNLGQPAPRQPLTPTEATLAALCAACYAFVQQLYARATARP